MAQIPGSGLSLQDNLLLNSMTLETWQETIIQADYGYNNLQTMIKNVNKKASIPCKNIKEFIPEFGKIGISGIVNGASTLSGANLVVTLQTPDTRYRVKDIVGDRNLIKGRIIQVISSTQLLLEPHTTTTWNTATHFTSGMSVTNFGDASGNAASTGKTSLSYSPDFDFALLGKKRETYIEDLMDRRNTKVMYGNDGKSWYTAQQQIVLKNYSRWEEMNIVFSDRVEKATSSVEGAYNTTGGIRWTAKNNGGIYYPISSNLTESILQNFIYDLGNQTAGGGKKKWIFYVGRDALAKFQNFMTPVLINSGDRNTFGGMQVDGYDLQYYSWGGVTIGFQLYDMFNDPATWTATTSSVTGHNFMASTIMAIDWSDAPSENGGASIPCIQQFHYAPLGAEVIFRYIPGMTGSNTGTVSSMGGNIIGGQNFEIATNDLDVCSWQLERFNGYYVIPQKVGWLELV